MTKLLSPHFQGLRTVTYFAPDLARAKDWYASVLGIAPYFEEPFYIGFSFGEYELGLDPDALASGAGGATAYWGVTDAPAALDRLFGVGARQHSALHELSEGIRVADVLDPFDNVLGIIENPRFKSWPDKRDS